MSTSWLDEGPDEWTHRYVAAKPLWLAVAFLLTMAMLGGFDD